MTWRRFSAAVMTATLFTALYGVDTPVLASVDKAALLAAIGTDQSTAHAWVLELGKLGYLSPDGLAIRHDVVLASTSVDNLLRKTQYDTSAVALSADSDRFTSLHAGLTSLEGSKVGLASIANADRAEFLSHRSFVHSMVLAGGMDPSSWIHAQTVQIATQMLNAQTDLDHAIAFLDRATLNTYPGSLALLAPAQSAINRATVALGIVDQLQLQDASLLAAVGARALLRKRVAKEILELTRLRAQVLADPNLNAGERTNLLGQINADLTAMEQLDRFAIQAPKGASLKAEWVKLLNEPGVFLLILPKAHVMLAAAADRSTLLGLNAMLPQLKDRIAAAAASHRDVTQLNALLSDMTTQLGVVSGEIAPIDAEFESMTAVTAAQSSHDARTIQSALDALRDANNRLSRAANDANQILVATS